MTQRWKNRPDGSNWGEFGPDDQKGRLNLLTPERVVRSVREVKTGERFCLSLPLDYPGGRLLNPRRFPPRLFATQRGGLANFNLPLHISDPRLTDVVCDDAALICLQYSTQWDSLCHVGGWFDADGDGKPEVVYYNGWRGDEHIVSPKEKTEADEFTKFEGSNAKALGIENMAEACVQGRGVLVDLEQRHGRDRVLVGYDELMRILEEDNIEIEEGDMACFHTGFAQGLMDMNKNPNEHDLHNTFACLDGRDEKLQDWIRDSGISVIIADNYGIEDVSSPLPTGTNPIAMLPLHELCIFKLGIHIGEMFYLTPLRDWLRKNKRNRFLLTAPPLRLPGAVGSPPSPIATV